MRKRRYIRAYTGIILTIGLIIFTLTDGFTASRVNLILFDPKGLYFVVLFTLIYSFMTDQGRAVSAQSIGLGMLYGGILGCLIGVILTLDLPDRDQALAWKYAGLPLWYGVIGKIFADAFGRDPEFFAFYRAMQAYEKALIGGDTSLILSPDSEFFKFFGNIEAKTQ